MGDVVKVSMSSTGESVGSVLVKSVDTFGRIMEAKSSDFDPGPWGGDTPLNFGNVHDQYIFEDIEREVEIFCEPEGPFIGELHKFAAYEDGFVYGGPHKRNGSIYKKDPLDISILRPGEHIFEDLELANEIFKRQSKHSPHGEYWIKDLYSEEFVSKWRGGEKIV